jgi:hypothetical protein
MPGDTRDGADVVQTLLTIDSDYAVADPLVSQEEVTDVLQAQAVDLVGPMYAMSVDEPRDGHPGDGVSEEPFHRASIAMCAITERRSLPSRETRARDPV